MNLRTFGLALSLCVVAACTKDKDVRLCNPQTLLLNFSCGEDLAEADGLEFQMVRNDGVQSTLTTSLSCPGARAYEVSISDYAQDQVFQIKATPLKGTGAAGNVNILSDLVLAPGCTSVPFPVTAQGGLVQPPGPDAGPGTGGSDGTQEAGVGDVDGNTIPVERGSKEAGVACAAGPECMSGFCADGVCCNNACEGACNACNLEGSKGQCEPTPSGQKPSGSKTCQTELVETCGFDGTCNGEGQCRKYPDQTPCVPGQCDGAGTRGRKVCMAGSCSAANDLACAPFGCDPAGVMCFAACETNAQCAPGETCKLDPDTNKKSCGKKLLGAVCGTGPECESGHCADGVCCGTACEGACRSCKLVGAVGECKTVPAGADDPRGECKVSAVGMCGQTGKCDASGACSKYSKGTVCLAAKCDGNDGVPPSECDGNGTCIAGRPVPCAPFICGGNACVTRCESNEQCAGSTSCVNNSCGLLPNGANCAMGSQCSSSFCIDGVCCNSACGGTCQFCNSATAKGTCTDVAAGVEDPRKKCEGKVSSTCETNGKCNGMRGCQLWAQGTECQARSCDVANNREIYAKQCDGDGKCNEVKAPQSCAPFTCGGNACANTCSRDDQCVAPNICESTLCGKKRNGQPCGGAAQCESGQCQQGVCCATACSGTCKSCAVSGKAGTCENVPAGLDLHNQCESTPSSGCKTTGACNGAGACSVYDSTAICEVAKCSADTSQEIGTSTCDGAGACKAPAGITCQNNLVCSGTSCKASCSGNGDCRNGTICNARTKQCAKPNGQTCGASGECGSDHCADGFCCNAACDGKLACTASGCRAQCSSDSDCASGHSCAQKECWRTSLAGGFAGIRSFSASAVSDDGAIYVAGTVGSAVTIAGVSHTPLSSSDLVLLKLSAAGVPQWARFFAVPRFGSLRAQNVLLDASQNVYVFGTQTQSSVASITFSTEGANQVRNIDGKQVFWASYTSTGNFRHAVTIAASASTPFVSAVRRSGGDFAMFTYGASSLGGFNTAASISTSGTIGTSKSVNSFLTDPVAGANNTVWGFGYDEDIRTLVHVGPTLEQTISISSISGDVGSVVFDGPGNMYLSRHFAGGTAFIAKYGPPQGATLGSLSWQKEVAGGYLTRLTPVSSGGVFAFIQSGLSLGGLSVAAGSGYSVFRLDGSGNALGATKFDGIGPSVYPTSSSANGVHALVGAFESSTSIGTKSLSAVTTSGVVGTFAP